ncbi:MAG: Crp/Fnr family transcriptional regulator [Cyanothece sp. SIO1E1]|nr:Crp/Fnr family transcriptional regulator [Cyanothece sp. SIO1E1]
MDLLMPHLLPHPLCNAATYRDLAAGQKLFQQGDPAVALFMVKTGRLKVVRHIDRHKMTTLQVARPNDTMGEAALFSSVHFCAAVAEITSQVIVYPKQALFAALRQYPGLAETLMVLMVKKIQSLKLLLELRDVRTAHERVLRYLSYLAQPGDPRVVSFDRPLKDIAGELGLTPETLSRALSRLEQEGAITRQQYLITVHDNPAA